MRVDLHKLHLMVPALGVLKAVSKIEVQQTDGVDRIEMKIPLASTLRLFADGKRGIVDGAVFEKLLVDVLHLYNKLLALVVLTINIEHGAAGIDAVAKLLRVEICDILNVLFAMEHRVQKAYKQFLVKL